MLFRHGHNQGELKPVISAFLESGYLSSAKHPFQLFRTAKIRDVDFLFNVDLLHNAPEQEDYDLFVDHLDLVHDDVVLYQYRSIVVPMSKLLFENTCSHAIEVKAITPEGTEDSFQFNLMNELGTLITKASSMKNVKRQRDSFDIMLAILQARDKQALAEGIRNLALSDRLASLRDITKITKYKENISKYYGGVLEEDVWLKYCEELNHFFDASFIPSSD